MGSPVHESRSKHLPLRSGREPKQHLRAIFMQDEHDSVTRDDQDGNRLADHSSAHTTYSLSGIHRFRFFLSIDYSGTQHQDELLGQDIINIP